VKLTSSSFADGGVIPAEHAFCAPDATSHVTLSKNHNPHLAWSDIPAGTKSFALICHDPDVPSRGEDVNQEGRTVAASLPRVDFFHWVMIDMPASMVGVMEGEFSSGVTRRGKAATPQGAHQGINDYTAWFASDPEMGGDYYGYDGPCPPWNDELPHRYVFTLYALDAEKLEIAGRVDGPSVRAAVQGHVLAEAAITARYTLNPFVKI
jgi:Raf kinase inhibitor-like YbhB/YbcL family protein